MTLTSIIAVTSHAGCSELHLDRHRSVSLREYLFGNIRTFERVYRKLRDGKEDVHVSHRHGNVPWNASINHTGPKITGGRELPIISGTTGVNESSNQKELVRSSVLISQRDRDPRSIPWPVQGIPIIDHVVEQ